VGLKIGEISVKVAPILMKRAFRVLMTVLALLMIFAVSGCTDRMNSWEKTEARDINNYITGLGDTAYVHTASGLYYIELVAGIGVSPVTEDTVTYRRKVTFLDGEVLESNISQDSELLKSVIGNGELISGLDEGFRYMKEGGTTRFLTPSSLAYGRSGVTGFIPGYTPLLWEITLLKVIPGPGK
jgi:FKBP-type peptidyl-prolyl cis-trans isomerase